MTQPTSAQYRVGSEAADSAVAGAARKTALAHDAGVCDCNAVVWVLVIDETRTIRRYRVWQCQSCKRLREREDPA